MFGPNVPQHPRRCRPNILETSGLQKHRQALAHLERAPVGKSLRSNESCSKLHPCLILQGGVTVQGGRKPSIQSCAVPPTPARSDRLLFTAASSKRLLRKPKT